MCNIFMDRKIRIVPVLTKKEKLESLEILNYQIRACQGCPLSESRKHALPGEGNVDSNIMIVALSPGAKENIANRMFVGPAGEVSQDGEAKRPTAAHGRLALDPGSLPHVPLAQQLLVDEGIVAGGQIAGSLEYQWACRLRRERV